MRSRKLNKFEDFVRRIVNSFNETRIDYMFTGALAASYYGTPRTTIDVDVIVRVSEKEPTSLVAALRKAGMEANERRIREVLKSGYKILTFKDKKSPFTLDIMLSDEKLRKRGGTILGLSTFYQVPEELILAKLRMIKATVPSERAQKDKDDVKAILRESRVNVDALKKRARKENTVKILEELEED